MNLTEILRQAALGCLFKGYLHNLRGPLQTLLMQIEILENRLSGSGDPGGFSEGLSRMKKQVFQMVDLLAAAEEDLRREDAGPWSIKEVLEKELSFWRGELDFKHKVEKIIKVPEALKVVFPYHRLRAGLCAVFSAVVFGLAERKGSLYITAEEGREGVELLFKVEPPFIDPEDLRLKAAREILAPEARIEAGPEEIKVIFPS